MQPHLVIVDGHHLLYRAYWAIPRTMKTSKGEQTNTTFGIASMLLQILRTEQPDSILFCFDADEDTFRHQEYPEYKAGRAKTPDDFHPQIPRAMGLIAAFGIKSVSGHHCEADDFAATYACKAAAEGQRVTIVTGDRDLLQLASSSIRIAIPHKGYAAPEYMGEAEVAAKFGVTPSQIPSYKGLVGDSSDNLPGVTGIGPKAAEALLREYRTLQGIYDHLSEVKASWRGKLEAGKEAGFFTERLATLKRDTILPFSLDALVLRDIPTEPILTLFKELEFTLPAKRLSSLLQMSYAKGRFVSSAEGETETPPSVIHAVEAEPAQMSLL
jgi:DNA polymerase I